MSKLLFFLIAGLFAALLFVNVYFRIKVMKSYKKLVKNRVQFGAVHLISKAKMEREILPQYPDNQEAILTFIRQIHFSIKVAAALIGLITLLGVGLAYCG